MIANHGKSLSWTDISIDEISAAKLAMARLSRGPDGWFHRLWNNQSAVG
jgi:hypothetical protein